MFMGARDLSSLIETADYLMAHKRHRDAIPLFQEALKHPDFVDSGKSEIFNRIGLCYLESGDSDEAVTYFNVALRFDPKNAIAFYNKGLIHQLAGELESAIEEYDQAIDARPGLAYAHNNKGVCLFDNGTLDGSLECFET